MGRWVDGRLVGGSVGKGSVGKGSVVGWSVVGVSVVDGFNKIHLLTKKYFNCISLSCHV